MYNKVYAGIGSRETPYDVIPVIEDIATRLKGLGYTLRSGAAGGADSFFERFAGDDKEIFLPWQGFRDHPSHLCTPTPAAWEMAKQFHPAFDNLDRAGKLLMARNSHQVFGLDMQTPVEFIICWTPNGEAKGGTSQAIRIARRHKIPVFNLAIPAELEEIRTRISIPPLF